jgi:hypothetical protein
MGTRTAAKEAVLMKDSMKPLVKTMAGVAVLLAGLAGCASKITTSAVPVGSGTGIGDTGSATSDGSALGMRPSPTTPSGVQLPSPSAHPTTAPGGVRTTPVPVPVTGDNIKYTSPAGVSVSMDGKTLVASVEWGGCSQQPQLIAVSQDSAKVVIEVKTVTHYKVGVMCPNIMRTGEASLVLAAPLGNRQLVDAVTNAPIPTR